MIRFINNFINLFINHIFIFFTHERKNRNSGITAIADALKSPDCELTTLKLPSNNIITDNGASLIADAINNSGTSSKQQQPL